MKATEEMSELRAAIEAAGASPELTRCTVLAGELATRIAKLEAAHEETIADWEASAKLRHNSNLAWLAVLRARSALAVPEYPQPRSFGRSNALDPIGKHDGASQMRRAGIC